MADPDTLDRRVATAVGSCGSARALALADRGCGRERPRDHAAMAGAGSIMPDMAEAEERASIARTVVLTDTPAPGRSAGTRARRPRPTPAGCWSRRAASSTTATPMTTTCRASSRSAGAATLSCPMPSTPTTCASRRAAASCGGDFAATASTPSTGCARGRARAQMMSVGLHLRIIGRPGRIAGLDRIVAHMKSKGGAWFATRRQIAEHWLARF